MISMDREDYANPQAPAGELREEPSPFDGGTSKTTGPFSPLYEHFNGTTSATGQVLALSRSSSGKNNHHAHFAEEEFDDEMSGTKGHFALNKSSAVSSAFKGDSSSAGVGGTRFGGLAAHVEASVASSIAGPDWDGSTFPVTAAQLGQLSNERNRAALGQLLRQALEQDVSLQKTTASVTTASTIDPDGDIEAPSTQTKLKMDVMTLADRLLAIPDDHDHEHKSLIPPEHSTAGSNDLNGTSLPVSAAEADVLADVGANVLCTYVLHSSPENGIDPSEIELRQQLFGTNALQQKKLESFLKLCWEAVQDTVLIMLIVLGTISIVVEVSTHSGGCSTCWIEGAAILCSVIIVVMVTAGIDYAKQFAMIRLNKNLHETNTKSVIRNGKQVSVLDDEIVVGDILSVNSHSLASIPVDCILLGPSADLKMNESALTGESRYVSKKPGDVVLSGTSAAEGSGKMVVIAVGVNSMAGRIKARVYESEDRQGELEGDDDRSPLFVKLEAIAAKIGIAGTVAATLALAGSCIIGFGIHREPIKELIEYIITAITVLAVAVPEGLPLAVTLSLAFSSNKMMKEQNLVKHLDACETMGCATTICTDKTGTLTANKMTARALYTGGTNYIVNDPSVTLGQYVRTRDGGASPNVVDLICRTIAIDTMNETVLYFQPDGKVKEASGNPTEVALLHLVHELGSDYEMIRNTTKGRSSQGKLGEYLALGKQYGFSSARKMMSWVVPREGGGYRLYCKGAQEVILARCDKYIDVYGTEAELSDLDAQEFKLTALSFARRGMRCLALAYRDLPEGFDMDATTSLVKNSDGSDAILAETDMAIIGLVGIEDPLRPEVPGAIEKCYQAGIDVRMVTGDNPNTAVSIAYQAGILRDFHFKEGTDERVAENLKENVLLEGKEFRRRVYLEVAPGQMEFQQAEFDRVWPYLRVLARSSPDDKLTLAHGLNQSNLFADKEVCAKLEKEGIKIFPDRQVVAMTGDGTNDAPALKRADIGFAMGVAGTQIAKDAADIILLDDNFASIVTAAKWGRNVYVSIQKFLQFQLTVNMAAVVTALVGAFAYQESPLAAIQLLWVNLLMDSLASLALASEPPVDELLKKPPVNRTDSMITQRMLANMLGQACYQIAVVMTLLFAGPKLLDLPAGNTFNGKDEFSEHYTIIFNSFVWMQLFNEINSRMLEGEFNVFAGLWRNPMFYCIWIGTAVVQALIVQYGSIAFRVHSGGLSWNHWILCVGLGLGAFPVKQVINVIYLFYQRHHISYRNGRRLAKDGHLSRQHVD